MTYQTGIKALTAIIARQENDYNDDLIDTPITDGTTLSEVQGQQVYTYGNYRSNTTLASWVNCKILYGGGGRVVSAGIIIIYGTTNTVDGYYAIPDSLQIATYSDTVTPL